MATRSVPCSLLDPLISILDLDSDGHAECAIQPRPFVPLANGQSMPSVLTSLQWVVRTAGMARALSFPALGVRPLLWGRSRPVRRARMVDAGKDSSLQLYTFDHYPTLAIH